MHLGDFGVFRLTLISEGALTEEEFKPSTIKPKVVFTASPDFKRELSSIHYERIHNDTPEPPPPPVE